MKRKFVAMLLAAMLMLGMTACSGDSGESKPESAPESSESSVESSEESSESEEMTEEEIKTVIKEKLDGNLKVMMNIYELGVLPYADDAVEGSWHRVTDENFPTFEALSNYVRGIYAKEFADKLLDPEFEHQKYKDIDGALCFNTDCLGGKGYYVNWDEYEIRLGTVSDDAIEFTAVASVEWPGENPEPEEYLADGKLVKEDDNWLLTSMVS